MGGNALSGHPRLIMDKRPLTASQTKPISASPRRTGPILAVIFNGEIHEAVGGVLSIESQFRRLS